MGRRVLAGSLISVAVLGLLLGALSLGIDRGILDEQRIGVLAGELTREPEVQDDVARRIVRTAVRRVPRARLIRGPLEREIASVVDTDEFRTVFSDAARLAFRTIDRGAGGRITLDLDRVWSLLPVGPELRLLAERAASLDGSATVELFRGRGFDRARRAVDLPERVGRGGFAVGGLAAILAIAIPGPRARRMALLGALLLGAAVLLLVCLPILAAVVASGLNGPGDAVARAVWDVAGRSIRTWVAGVMVGGLAALLVGVALARFGARSGGGHVRNTGAV
jgi:hypothetical protein